MIREWDIIISGFRQRRGAANGSDLLWAKLRRFQSPRRELMLYEWRDNMQRLATRIARHSDRGIRPVVRVYAYSWGAGHAFPNLARALWDVAEYSVDAAVLCDPVYRSKWLPWWLPANPSALMSWPQITVPMNVDQVRWLRQSVSRPKGHRLVAEESDMTRIHDPIQLHRPHIGADSAQEYHELALQVAGERFRQPALPLAFNDE